MKRSRRGEIAEAVLPLPGTGAFLSLCPLGLLERRSLPCTKPHASGGVSGAALKARSWRNAGGAEQLPCGACVDGVEPLREPVVDRPKFLDGPGVGADPSCDPHRAHGDPQL